MFPTKPTFCRLMMGTGRRILPETEPRLLLGQESGTELLMGSVLFAKLCSWLQTLKIVQFEQKAPGPQRNSLYQCKQPQSR